MMFWVIFIIGGGLYLLMYRPIIFWLVALPLGLLTLAGIVGWLKK